MTAVGWDQINPTSSQALYWQTQHRRVLTQLQQTQNQLQAAQQQLQAATQALQVIQQNTGLGADHVICHQCYSSCTLATDVLIGLNTPLNPD